MLDMAVLEVVCHAVVDNQNSGKRKESFSCIVHWSWKYTVASKAVVLTLKIKKKKKKKKRKEGREGGRKRERKERKKEKFPRWEKRRNKVAWTRAEPLLVS